MATFTSQEAKRIALDAEIRNIYNAIKEAANEGLFSYKVSSLSDQAREKLKNAGYHFTKVIDGIIIKWSQ